MAIVSSSRLEMDDAGKITYEVGWADWLALKRFDRPSVELTQQIEEVAGKPFDEIPMGKLNDIFPGLYASFFIRQIPAALAIYEDLKSQVGMGLT